MDIPIICITFTNVMKQLKKLKLMGTIFEQNVVALTDRISTKIGYSVSNKSIAIELLDNYGQSNTKRFSKLFYSESDGILKAKLSFKK